MSEYILNEHCQCIKISLNKPMLGPVVLEITTDIFINKITSFALKHVVGLKNTNI